MAITRDTVMDNGKQYYIFEYNVTREDLNNWWTVYDVFTPQDPVRVDEKGDIYAYDDSTQNEYLYQEFSEAFNKGISVMTIIGHHADIEGWPVYPVPTDHFRELPFLFRNNVGMISIYFNIPYWTCSIFHSCEYFFNQTFILIYAIIDGEKVYSIEDTHEYLWWYMRTNDINSMPTYPQETKLHQNYPNPFNPETRIDFEIPKTEKVKLVIYNTLGKEVKTLLDDELQAGKYSTTWNGKDDRNNKVSSGIYFYQLTFGNNMQSTTKKMIILK